MAIGVVLLVILLLSAAIWIIIEVKRLKHKIFAIVLIAALLFFYLSIVYVFRGYDFELKTIPGITDATKIYFSWLGGVFGNTKTITSNAIKMDWGVNSTSGS